MCCAVCIVMLMLLEGRCVTTLSLVGINDLFGSFASGRLYTQVLSMTRHYSRPVLLIEFEADHAFQLVTATDLPAEVPLHHILSRVSLLVLSFPQLRVLWSRSPYATVALFHALQSLDRTGTAGVAAAAGATTGTSAGVSVSSAISSGKAIPHLPLPVSATAPALPVPAGLNIPRIIQAGSNQGKARTTGQNDHQVENSAAIEFLLELPGITRNNYKRVLDNINCIADLLVLSESQLCLYLEPSNAALLYRFIHTVYDVNAV